MFRMCGLRVARALRLVAVAAVLLAAMSACSGRSGAGQGDPTKVNLSSVTLKVGQTGWAMDQAALQVAGLDHTPYAVQWPVFPGGDKQLQALQANALDVTESSETPPVFAAGAGHPKFAIGAVERQNTLLQEVVVPGGSPITSMAALKGKRVGYVQNTTAQYFLDKLLEREGLHWSDILPAPLSPNDGVTALQSGSIDALASYGDSIITAHQTGARTIGDGKDILSGNFPWEVSTTALGNASQRAAIVDLLARINRARAFIRNGHEQEYAQRWSAATHEPFSEALDQLRSGEAQIPTTIGPTNPSAVASEQNVADTFAGLKVLPGRVDASSLFTDTLNADLQKALAAPAN
jgi:sulfonate transport system substrate-binding protein